MKYALCLAVLVIFFLCEHKLTVSRDEGFTSTADQMELQADGGNNLRRLVFGGLGILGMFLSIFRPTPKAKLDSLLPICVLGFLLFAFASVTWSDSASMTFRRVAVLACFALGAYGISKTFTLIDLLYLIVFVCSVTLAIGFICEVMLGTFRPWASDYRFSGTVHPNTQGLYLTSLCLATYCLMRQGAAKRGMLPLFLIGLVFLLLTKSRTSCAGLILALSAIWVLRSPKGLLPIVVAAGVWFAATVGLFVSFLALDFSENVSNAVLLGREEQAESLTGRLPIWETLAPYVHDRLLFGYGYDSFWIPSRVNAVSSELHWGIREAHSAYIEMVLGVGLIGAACWLIVVLWTLVRAVNSYSITRNEGHAFLFGLIIFGLINGFTESGMIMPLFVPFVVLVGIMHHAFFLVTAPAPTRSRSLPRPSFAYQA
jgi:O-antigen ligase